jgi:UrcA family protein
MNSPRLFASVISLGALAGAILLLAPQVTYAASSEQAPAETVHFSDLDLKTHHGVAVLYGRIRTAATDVCSSTEPRGTLLPSAAHQACLRNAVQSAVRSVDSPALSQYYRERDGQAASAGWLVNAGGR